MRASESHKQLLSTIAVSKEYLGMSYEAIYKMPLRDFFDLLKIRSEEERRKAEYLKQQQSRTAKEGGVQQPKNALQNLRENPGQFFKVLMGGGNSQT